jgi:predicted phage tail protein
MAADGTYNFNGVTWAVRLGTPTQDPVEGYPAAEETVEVGYVLKHANGPFIRTITSTTANAVLLTMAVPSLLHVDSNGNVNPGPDLQWQIEIQPVGGLYTTAVIFTLTGQKCTSAYEKTHRIVLPNRAALPRGTCGSPA